MKNTIKGGALVLSVLLAGAIHASAQEFKTDESISSQLKNGTAPGLKFRPTAARSARVAKTATDPNEGRETPASQIKKGTLKGVQYAGGSTGARSMQRSARPAARVQAGNKLPSDEKATVQKPIISTKPEMVPTQDRAVDTKDSKVIVPAKSSSPRVSKQD